MLHRQEVLDGLLSRLHTAGWTVRRIFARLHAGGPARAACARCRRRPAPARRDRRSLAYLPLYGALDTEKLDVSACTPEEAAEAILAGGRQ